MGEDVDKNRALVKLTIGSGIALGSLVIGSGLTGVGGIVITGLLANVAVGIATNAIEALIADKDSDPGLTKAVGKAIAKVIREAAEGRKNGIDRKLKEIAQQAENNWVTIAQQELYPQLREAKLDQLLTSEKYRLTQEGNLSGEDWKNIFTQLYELHRSSCAGQTSDFYDMSGGIIAYSTSIQVDSDFQLPSKIFSDVANLLHTEFPKALEETFKEDFDNEGKAFAGLILQLITGMKAEINKQGKPHTEEFDKILECISEVEGQLNGTPEQRQKFFTNLSKQMESGFAVVNNKLDIANNKLDILLQKIYAPGDQSKDLYLKHYVERPPLEDNVRKKIEACSPMRIKGLKDTGKTYLLNQVIIAKAKKLGYLTINLSLGIANTSNLNDDNDSKFFKWLCDSMLTDLKSQLNSNESAEIIKQLENFDFDYSKTGQYEFKICLQKILESIQPQKLLLALDHVDYIFEYKDVANSLGQILRHILDNKQGAYEGLCLVILHSTEEYAKLSVNHSPFGSIGIPYILEDFTLEQIKKDLFYQYNLKWQDSDLDQLISLVGGHPFLIIKAFEDSQNFSITPSQLLENAGTNAGIYASLFLQQLETLNLAENSFLKEKFKSVIMSETEIELDLKATFLLQSMGLIKVNGRYVSPRCQLYRKYFKEELSRND